MTFALAAIGLVITAALQRYAVAYGYMGMARGEALHEAKGHALGAMSLVAIITTYRVML